MKQTPFKGLMRRLSIRIPLQLILLLTLIFAAAAAGAGYLLSRSTVSRARETLGTIAANNATLAGEFFLGIDTKAKTLAQTFNILRTDAKSAWQAEDSIEKLLRETLKEERVYSAHAAFVPDGFLPDTPKGVSIRVVRDRDTLSTEVFQNATAYTAMEYYSRCSETKSPHITEPYAYETKKKETVSIVSVCEPILDEQGNFLGVAVLDVLAGSVDALQYDDGGYASSYAYLMTKEGAYLAHTKRKEAIGTSLLKSGEAGAEEVHASARRTEGVLLDQYKSTDGAPLYLFVYPMQVPGMQERIISVLAVEQQEPSGRILSEFRSMPFLLLGGIVCFGVAASLLLRRALKPVGEIVRFSEQLMEGNLDGALDVRTNDELADIGHSVTRVRDTLVSLLLETGALTDAALSGNLSVRAEEARHRGAYRAMIAGVNRTIDALTEPMAQVSRMLNSLSKGELEDRFTGEYAGDFSEMQQSLNGSMEDIASYIAEISAVLQRVAQGDLSVELTREYVGAFDALKQSINAIIHAMNDVIGNIGVAAEQVAAGTRQVSVGSQMVSAGAAEQADAISALTSAMAGISAQTQENVGHAGDAEALSLAAIARAKRGEGQMKNTQAAMREISAACKEISQVIRVIDEIAFQTNILALNAAVEAAHAGSYGKGFAVVAEEVRSLAARSAQAAQETAGMVHGALNKAQAGGESLQLTAQALAEMVQSIEQEAALIGVIVKASDEQAAGITQVDKNISQLSYVVQANSATAEETAAASEELSGQAELLKELVGRFQIKTDREEGAEILKKEYSLEDADACGESR